MTRPDLRETAAEIVERTCREQGVSVEVTDPDALRRIAALLTPPERRRGGGRTAKVA